MKTGIDNLTPRDFLTIDLFPPDDAGFNPRRTLRDFEPDMSGAYSNTETRKIVTLEERETDQGDAPCYNIINQSELTPEMATEILEFI